MQGSLMKVCVYNSKGGAGKTPIATNIVLDREYALATNEYFHVFDGFIPDDRLMAVNGAEEFPEIPRGIDIVFDLAGSISENSASIISAVKQCDLVIVPIFNEVKSLRAGIGTIREVERFTDSIVVVATKLNKSRKDRLEGDWKQCADFRNIQAQLQASLDFTIDILPLKQSKVFDDIFEFEQSIQQIMDSNPLRKFNYRAVSAQFDEIYNHIDRVSDYAKQEQSDVDQVCE